MGLRRWVLASWCPPGVVRLGLLSPQSRARAGLRGPCPAVVRLVLARTARPAACRATNPVRISTRPGSGSRWRALAAADDRDKNVLGGGVRESVRGPQGRPWQPVRTTTARQGACWASVPDVRGLCRGPAGGRVQTRSRSGQDRFPVRTDRAADARREPRRAACRGLRVARSRSRRALVLRRPRTGSEYRTRSDARQLRAGSEQAQFADG